jgi:membrane-bound lytic murein transglycosylase D
MWQFLAWRGQEYGLMRTAHTDDRLDPEKATRAAARHLRDLYAKFGDWYLAIAAYNCGPGTVEKAVERTGYADFWELRNRRVLPLETTNYVPIILAMTIMSKNGAEYGLDKVVPEKPLEYDTVEISSPTHLALVADLTGAPVYELRNLNPSLLKGDAPAGYSLHVPRGTADSLVASLDTIPAGRRASWRMHKVEHGDTLASIGKRYGAAPSSIAEANRMDSVSPVVGDMLVVPAAHSPEKSAKAKSASSPRRAARGRRVSVKASAARHVSRGSTHRRRAHSRPAPGRRASPPMASAPVPRG